MAWFLNFYDCDRCQGEWTDEWSCTCEDDCPHCGARHMCPTKSEDLTEIIEQDNEKFVVIRSPDSAEHDPDYEQIGQFATRAEAEAFLDSCEAG